MKKITLIFTLLLPLGAVAQTPAPPPQPVEHITLAKALDDSVARIEKQMLPAAEAMPEDKYVFAPTAGVRTFGQQLRHVATGNYWFGSSVLGERMPVMDDPEGNGPKEHKTKVEIIQYLKDSFVYVRKAILTINDQNALVSMKPSWGGTNTMTRVSMASLAGNHGFDHYGQLVVYLRLNGIVPPASRK